VQKTIYQRLNAVLWTLIVCLVVLLAIYVSVGRMLVSNMGVYRGDILQEINARVPFIVEADGVAGEWQSFTPIIVLSGLRLTVPPGDQPPLTLSEGRIAVDVFESLRTRSLQMARIELEDLALRGELTEEGRFRLEGLGAGGEIGDWLRDFILNVELVSLRQNTLSLGLPGGERRQLDLSLRLERDGSLRRLEVGLESSRGARITVLGEGVGDPFIPELFTGELYTRITTDDLGAVRQMLSDRLTGTWAEGSVDMELWLAFERGETELQGRLNASDLLVANEDRGWKIPLEKLALEAELAQGRDRWTLFGTDLEVRQEGVAISVPRLQLDGWGQALRLRAAHVPLGPLADLVMGLPPVPGKLAEAMQLLDPDGNLSTLQVSVGDIQSPRNDWEIEARFSDLQVASWRGAPGVSSATGYLEIFPGYGQVLLDSSNLVLDFPVIYRDPLEYNDFHGALHIGWDAERMRITSDMIVAVGDEGAAKALFGLEVPFTASNDGMDMSLLVGLENSHPMHRVKYVPDNLNPTLRDWLVSSVGDGFVQQGAFLWRGSLRKGAAARRTVQLAFNVTDTFVDYHPRWPAVEVVSGVILVDDSEVSVWAGEALFRDSTVKRLSVETWLEQEGQLMLAVDGRMQGPAADGLAVINASPIDGIVNGAFRGWAMQGGLEVDLNFQLNLSDMAVPPQVDVDTRWREVDIDILPGDVHLRDIEGNFSYDSARGFATSGLGGTFWGKPFSLDVHHPGLESDRDFDPASTATELRAVTRVDLADLRRWLKFEPLAFAQGVTAAEVKFQVEPGQAPLLRVDSALEGVSLDFPSPWGKDAGENRPLRVSLALGEQGGPLELSLGDDLFMQLDLRGRRVNSAALGIGGPPGELAANSLRVTGRAPLVQVDEWSRFISSYFDAGWATALDREIPDRNLPADDQVTTAMAIVIDDLRADTMEIGGQAFPDVTFSLEFKAGRWRLSGTTDWLEGEYLQEPGRE
jgi:uncharacterized protein YhdP